MPPVDDLDDKDQELESSANSVLDDAAEEPNGKAADATSSPATGETDSDETPNIVRDVVDARQDKAAAASPADGAQTGADAGGAATQKELDNENFTDVPFHKHPRFQHVIRERNSFREDAGRYRNVQTFLDSNGLSSEEAADGLSIMAQAKTDPVGAWNAIKPWVQKVLIAAGEVLPDELSQRVQKGELTQDAALELSRANARANSLTAKQEFDRTQNERRQQTQAATELVTAANDWDADRQLKDPNYAAKSELIQREVLWLQKKEGLPKDKAGVLKMLNTAYESVNKSFKKPTPATRTRPALRPVVSGHVAGSASEAPKNTLDLIRQRRAQRRGAA